MDPEIFMLRVLIMLHTYKGNFLSKMKYGYIEFTAQGCINYEISVEKSPILAKF